MALVEPNFSEVADAIVPGDYQVRVVDAAPGTWKTGTKHIAWTLETMNETEAKNNGRRMVHRTPTEGKGAFRLQQFYRAATGEVLKGNFDTEQLLGKELLVTVKDSLDKEGNQTGYTEVAAVRQITQ